MKNGVGGEHPLPSHYLQRARNPCWDRVRFGGWGDTNQVLWRVRSSPELIPFLSLILPTFPDAKWISRPCRSSKPTAWSCRWRAAWGLSWCWSHSLPVPESRSQICVCAPWQTPAKESRLPSDMWVLGLVTSLSATSAFELKQSLWIKKKNCMKRDPCPKFHGTSHKTRHQIQRLMH